MRIAIIHVSADDDSGLFLQSMARLMNGNGHKTLFCYSRGSVEKDIAGYQIGNKIDWNLHLFLSRLTDRSGFFSKRETDKFIRQLKKFRPDLIHLGTLHGYYLNLPVLFGYLRNASVPVIWSISDCWPITGHCIAPGLAKEFEPLGTEKRRSRLVSGGCVRWRGGCGKCPLSRQYPTSYFADQSAKNQNEKRLLFSGLKHMLLTVPSAALQVRLANSYLKSYPLFLLPAAADSKLYAPCDSQSYMLDILRYYHLEDKLSKHLLVSICDVWDERCGLEELVELAEALGPDYSVIAVGLDEYQIRSLPPHSVIGLESTGNKKDTCALVSAADLYISTMREDFSGLSLLKALSCGTQVLCWDDTAARDIVTEEVGAIAETGNIRKMCDEAIRLCDYPKESAACRKRALAFSTDEIKQAFAKLYENAYKHSPGYEEAVLEAKDSL